MPLNPWKHPSFPNLIVLTLILYLSSPTTTTLGLNPQGEVLLSWKKSLNAPFTVLDDWDPNHDTPCKWYGITCDIKNQVTELNLSYVDLNGAIPSNLSTLSDSMIKLVLTGANLTGIIPKEIGLLKKLEYFDVSDNALHGEIPKEIGNLVALEQLVLNSNNLAGSIPVEIGNLASLEWLILYDNQLSGSIPHSIGNMKNLSVVRAGGNKNLEGMLPPEIGNCSNLVMLGLAETSISGSLPSTLGQLKNLQTLAIYTALLSGTIPPEIGDCTSLQNIYLYENRLTGSIPTHLGNLSNLQNLLLWQNELVGTLPTEFGRCTTLQVIDISMNSLTGSIPESYGNLASLQELQLSMNQISGKIPNSLGNCRSITHIELDNNQLSGSIPVEFGQLENLTLLFLWQNKLEGNIPVNLSSCSNLEAMDVSLNGLTGPIPKWLFQLQRLNKLLLLSNNLSGSIPPEIGQCTSLVRFRASNNQLTGEIPSEVGNLTSLSFLDLGSNRLTGIIPEQISGCRNLTFLDLHSNSISGELPASLSKLSSLQFIDVSDNQIGGALKPSLGSLGSLTKLVLGRNNINGSIPSEIGSCSKLQLIDLSSNHLSGEIPNTMGKIPGLEIAVNFSWNNLSGVIPTEFSTLNKLGVLDLSHNQLSGDLQNLAGLQNLVVLNISYNNFSGHVPETTFFTKLPLSVLEGNPELCITGNKRCDKHDDGAVRHMAGARVAMVVLLCTAFALLLAALYIMFGNKDIRRRGGPPDSDLECCDSDVEMGPPCWEVTLYQKLDLSVVDVSRCLTPNNVIGRGRTATVYKASLSSPDVTIAVKKFRSSESASAAAYSSEIATLASIRHRNIVRLLGLAANRKTKLLFYDYLCNGTLGAMLHEGGNSCSVEWETRFKIALGVAEGLAYLHHDCVPAIVHRDVKTHNILLGDRYEACLADFGLATLLEDEDGSNLSADPHFAGSYGYMAPEYASALKITKKTDVYSYGVVLLEILTGRKPVDPSLPDGQQQHVIGYVRDHLKSKKDPVEVIDPKLQGHKDTQIQEMLQALGIALLCTSHRPEDRPTMKDVAALLKEIIHDSPNEGQKKLANNAPEVSHNSSFSSSPSVTPAELLRLQRLSNSSLPNYSSSSANYPSSN